MKSSIRALAEFILQNVDTIEEALEKRGAAVPSLDDPFTPGSDIANGQPELMATTELTVRAASQLIQDASSTSVQRHSRGSLSTFLAVYLTHRSVNALIDSTLPSATLRCVTDLNIAEILREAGP